MACRCTTELPSHLFKTWQRPGLSVHSTLQLGCWQLEIHKIMFGFSFVCCFSSFPHSYFPMEIQANFPHSPSLFLLGAQGLSLEIAWVSSWQTEYQTLSNISDLLILALDSYSGCCTIEFCFFLLLLMNREAGKKTGMKEVESAM